MTIPSPTSTESRTPSQHPVGKLLSNTSTHWILRWALVLVGTALTALSWSRVLLTLEPEYLYRQDLLQEYLLAEAVLRGDNPYLPVPELAERYLGFMPATPLYLPTPHPPTVGLLFLPLRSVDYPTAAAIWLVLQALCLALSVYALGRTCGAHMSPWKLLALAGPLCLWLPVMRSLFLGQLMLPLLLVLVGAYLATVGGRQVLSAALVGLSLLVKPVAWPLLLLFAVRRQWGPLATSGAVLLVGYLAAAVVLGVDQLTGYFTQVLPAAAEQYRGSADNLSLWSIGWRLFEGTYFGDRSTPISMPLVRSTVAAIVVSILFPAFSLALAAKSVSAMRSPALAFAVLVCVGILVSPIAWDHYLVLALIPAAQIIRMLFHLRFPLVETRAALLITIGLLAPTSLSNAWLDMARTLAAVPPGSTQPYTLPTLLTLAAMLPSVVLASLAWLLVSLDRQSCTCASWAEGAQTYRT